MARRGSPDLEVVPEQSVLLEEARDVGVRLFLHPAHSLELGSAYTRGGAWEEPLAGRGCIREPQMRVCMHTCCRSWTLPMPR